MSHMHMDLHRCKTIKETFQVGYWKQKLHLTLILESSELYYVHLLGLFQVTWFWSFAKKKKENAGIIQLRHSHQG